jgi:RNA polymerase sigma-70 factor (ECF subfamily)
MLQNDVVVENDLVSQAQNGDRAAFGELVCRYHSRVINIIYRMCGNSAVAEDAAQEAFLNAWQRLTQFRLGSRQNSFRSWLYRIALNAALDILRGEKVQVDIEDLPLASTGAGLEDGLEHKESLRQVRQAVMALPGASRAVLVLKEYEGLSYREIADTLDIPLGTVMSRLNYARNQLALRLRSVMEVV